MHIRGPAPKGKYASLWRPAVAAGRNRSGSNTRGLSQKRGDLCTTQGEMSTVLPAGMA